MDAHERERSEYIRTDKINQDMAKEHDIFQLGWSRVKRQRKVDANGNPAPGDGDVREYADSEGRKVEIPERIPADTNMPENEVKPSKKEEE